MINLFRIIELNILVHGGNSFLDLKKTSTEKIGIENMIDHLNFHLKLDKLSDDESKGKTR